jgi:hypothetical protein
MKLSRKKYLTERCPAADFGVFHLKRVLEEIAIQRERDVPGLGLEHSKIFR